MQGVTELAAPLGEAQKPDASEDAEADGDFLQTVTRLASLSPHEYERLRKAEANRLNVRVAILDGAVKAARSAVDADKLQGRAVEWREPEPWPEPVTGDMLLSDIAGFLWRYVAMSEALADTIALWTVMTWLHGRLELSTLLSVTSATKRCGKSLLMETLGCLVHRPLPVSGRITSAVLFRIIERDAPTMLLDEADTFFGNDAELRGIVNGSQRRDSASLLRCVGEDHEPRRFVTWCPKAIAGIGGLPDTVLDRSLVIRLERRPPGHKVTRWRDRDRAAITTLQRQVARWVADNANTVLERRNDVSFPVGLHDRACDAWEALLAIADTAGGDWAGDDGRAWRACALVTEDAEGETGAGEKLIADLRDVFQNAGDPSALPTTQILETLWAMEGRPWSEWRCGKPLSARGLSDLLKPFKVRPVNIRVNGLIPKGYKIADLVPIWNRYAVDKGSQSATPLQFNEINGLEDNQSATPASKVAVTKGYNPLKTTDCSGVAGTTPPNPDKLDECEVGRAAISRARRLLSNPKGEA